MTAGYEPPDNDAQRFVPAFYDDYSLYPDGAAPAVSESGDTYQHVGVATTPVIVNGGLTNTAVAGAAASYSNAPMGSKVTRIGCRFRLGVNGGTHQGGVVLVIWERPMGGAVPNSPCHLIITDTVWEYSRWVEGVGPTQLATGTFPTALVAGDYSCDVFIEGNTATLLLPNDTIAPPIVHASIAGSGAFAGFEVFQTNAVTDSKGAFLETWADVGSTPDQRDTYPKRAELTDFVSAILANRLSDLWIPAKDLNVTTGAAAMGLLGAGYTGALMFDAAAVEAASATVNLPADWRTFNFILVWTNAGAGAGACRWTAGYSKGGDGELLTAALANLGAATIAAPLLNVEKWSTMLAAIPVGGKRTFTVIILRTGSDAADTLGNDAGVLGILLNRTS